MRITCRTPPERPPGPSLPRIRSQPAPTASRPPNRPSNAAGGHDIDGEGETGSRSPPLFLTIHHVGKQAMRKFRLSLPEMVFLPIGQGLALRLLKSSKEQVHEIPQTESPWLSGLRGHPPAFHRPVPFQLRGGSRYRVLRPGGDLPAHGSGHRLSARGFQADSLYGSRNGGIDPKSPADRHALVGRIQLRFFGPLFLHRGRNRGVPRLISEEHTSELQSREKLVCRLLLENQKR